MPIYDIVAAGVRREMDAASVGMPRARDAEKAGETQRLCNFACLMFVDVVFFCDFYVSHIVHESASRC